MQKVLEITADQFIKNGISTNAYSTLGGLFQRAYSVDPFKIPGLLLAGWEPAEIGTGGIVEEDIKHFVQTVGTTDYLTMYGAYGGLMRLDLATDTVTSLRTVADSTGQGLSLFLGSVYYSRNSTIGKMTDIEAAPPTFDDDYKQLLYSNTNHPLHTFQGYQFCGDKDVISSDDGTDYIEAALVIGSDYTIVDIDDDGYYLIIGAVKEAGSNSRKETHIFYWDTVSPNFNIEFVIEEGNLTSLSKFDKGRTMIAFTGSGAYVFNYASSPTPFLASSDSVKSPFITTDLQPSIGGVGSWKNQLTWAAKDRLLTYGKVLNNTPKIFTSPIALEGIESFYVNASYQIYASAKNNLYKCSTGYKDAIFETNMIELPQLTAIKAIKLYIADPFTATTSIEVRVTNEAIETSVIETTFDSATYGTTNRVFRIPVDAQTEYLRVIVEIIGGATFRKVELWGDPIPNERIV